MVSKYLSVPVGFALAVGLVAAVWARDEPVTSTSCAAVLDSEICTWVVMDEGSATELGATIPLSLIEGVPTDVPMVWPPQELATVTFPPEARAALGIDHLGVNWEAHGHPPASFLTQHFDFHFYSISEAEVSAIDCSDESKPVRLPAGYALPDVTVPEMGTFIGLCVPAMGMHAMRSGEVHETDAFEASMMMGYYGTEPIFFEPMVSRERLLRRTAFSLPVPVVEGLPAGTVYPRAFRAEYDATADQYRLIFTRFDSE